MTKKLLAGLFVALVGLMIAAPVLAAYYANIDVTESNGTNYDMVAISATLPIDGLADNGFIRTDGRDVQVKNGYGAEVPFMLANDKLLLASDIVKNSVNRFQFTTGNTPLSSFPVITGDGGYVTIPDHNDLELGSDFEIEFEGWIDTSVDTNPNIASTATSTENTSVTSHDISLPSGIEAGDLLLLLFGSYAGTTPAITWPSGWTQLDKHEANNRALGIAYKIADGTEASPVVVVTSVAGVSAHQTFRINSYQGVPEVSTKVTGNSQLPNSGSLTTSWGADDGRETLWLTLFSAGDANSVTLSSYPTPGYSGGQFTKSSAGYAYAGSAYRVLSAASEDPGQFAVSNTIVWAAWTVGISGEPYLLKKKDAFTVYIYDGDICASILGGSPKTVTASGFGPREYIVKVWADGTWFGIDIDGEFVEKVAVSSVPSNDLGGWIISMPYFNYYTHKVGVNDRILYQPDGIISGATLPNELNPGTYEGVITWGSKPDGISVAISRLQLEEGYYWEDIDIDGGGDIFKPEPARLTYGVNLEKLEKNPLSPGVQAIAEVSNGLLPEELIWLGGAIFILAAAVIGTLLLSKEHISYTAAVGLGLTIMFYVMGIFDYWVIIIFAVGLAGSIIHERAPTW